MWFHRPFRADDWLLYHQTSPSAHGARASPRGRSSARDGTLAITVIQEGLIRPIAASGVSRAMPSPDGRVDLRSDTVTTPTPEMRRAMAEAEVGDDVYGEDPTVNRLQELAAELLGKEAALYVPSGTMANQLALRVLGRPGTEVLCARARARVPLRGGRGGVEQRACSCARSPTTTALLDAADRRGGHRRQRLPHADGVAGHDREHAHAERAGGRGGSTRSRRWPPSAAAPRPRRCTATAPASGTRRSRSGSRRRSSCAGATTVMFCVSKGLGAPVGSVLCGPADVIAEAREHRQRLGGDMRQAG